MDFWNNFFWKFLFYLNNSNLNIILIFLIFICLQLNNNFFFKIEVFILFFIVLFIFFTKIKQNETINHIFINKELYNGILLVHPILTYITVNKYFVLYKYDFFLKNLKTSSLKKDSLKIIFVGSISLVLGSLWAQQELNWGGWWNWDAVEIILLCLNLVILFTIHTKDKKSFYNYTNIIYKNKFVYLLIFYFIVRSNFINSVHAFSISNQIQKYFYIIVIALILTLCLYYFLIKNKTINKIIFLLKFSKKNYKSFFKTKINSNIWFFFINSVVIAAIYLSMFMYVYKTGSETNYFHYVGFFLKVFLCFFFFFNTSNKKYFKKNIVILCILNFLNVIVSVVQSCVKSLVLKNFFTKKEHVLVIVIFFLILTDCDIIILNNNPLRCLNTHVHNYLDIIMIGFPNIFVGFFKLYNANASILLENNNNHFDVLLRNGTNTNYFTSNLIISKNTLLINYIIDNNAVFFKNYNMLLSAVIVFVFFAMFLKYFYKNKNIFINGIV